MDKIIKSEEEWQKELSPELYKIARGKGTESAFAGKYYKSKEDGIYKCAVCGNELFSSKTKFDSGTGWPSFTNPVNTKNIEFKEDLSHGMRRTEVVCGKCGAHLGHVFDDLPVCMRVGPDSKRYCINSICLDLEGKDP